MGGDADVGKGGYVLRTGMWARVHSRGKDEDDGARMRIQTRVYGVDKMGMRTRARVHNVVKDEDVDKDARRGQG